MLPLSGIHFQRFDTLLTCEMGKINSNKISLKCTGIKSFLLGFGFQYVEEIKMFKQEIGKI